MRRTKPFEPVEPTNPLNLFQSQSNNITLHGPTPNPFDKENIHDP